MTDVSCHLAYASKGAIMTPPRSRQTPLSPLRAKMLQQMQLRRLAPLHILRVTPHLRTCCALTVAHIRIASMTSVT